MIVVAFRDVAIVFLLLLPTRLATTSTTSRGDDTIRALTPKNRQSKKRPQERDFRVAVLNP